MKVGYFLISLLILNRLHGQELLTGVTTVSPVTFMENKGQWENAILYQGTSTYTNVYFLNNGLSFARPVHKEEKKHGPEDYAYEVWNMKFSGISNDLAISGTGKQEGRASFFKGKDPAKWVIRPPEFSTLNYNNIYKNTDLVFYGNGHKLKYDFIIHPGADLNEIKTWYEGIQKLSLNKNGDLEVKLPDYFQKQNAPVAWQIKNGIKEYVKIKYQLINDTTFGFVAPQRYDTNYDLVIDPLFERVWASHTGAIGAGDNINYCFSNAMDESGNVYVTGMVDQTYPITPGAYSGPGSVVPEIFVSKFSSDGTTLIYSTYISGSSREIGLGIAVDGLGRAYITGFAEANFTGGNTYPTTSNAYQQTLAPGGGSDVILSVLNPTGTDLVYSSFIGGSHNEEGYDIELGSDGIAYITGFTMSVNFPVKASSAMISGTQNVFVAKFDIDQSGDNSLIYSVKFGGDGFAKGRGIAVNSSGNAFVTGSYQETGSPSYPTTPGAFNTIYNGTADNMVAVVTKLSSGTPVTFEYSTFLGSGTGSGIAVDASDQAYITGSTNSFNFPVTPGALQTIHGQDALANPNADVFVTKLNAAGTSLIYSTFIGGPSSEGGSSIRPNSLGEAYIAGITLDNFPVSPGAFQTQNAGSFDFLLVHLNQDGSDYACGGSTLIGGNDADYNSSIYDYVTPILSIRDHGGSNDTISISGTTHSTNFPTTAGSYQPAKLNGIADQPVFMKFTCFVTGVPPNAAISYQMNSSCLNSSVDFTDNSTNNPETWEWTFEGATPASSILENPQDIIYPATGEYTVQLITCNEIGCDTSSTLLEVIVPEEISVSIGNDTTICPGSIITITASPQFNQYSWQFNGNELGNFQSIDVSDPGIYSISVDQGAGCAARDSLTLSLSEAELNLGADLFICDQDSVLIAATDGYPTYEWQLNGNILSQTGPSFFTEQTGTYRVEVTDTLGCIASDEIMVQEADSPVAAFTPSLDLTCNSYELNALNESEHATTFQWRLNGAVISTAADLVYELQSSEQVNLELIASNGNCSDTALVVDILANTPLFDSIPNVFSPNGDGINDCFEIAGTENFADCIYLLIYNRWGILVHQEENNITCWDGLSDSEPLPDGVYFYILGINDLDFHGVVHLIR